jgi:hypothetical protein
MKKVFIIILFAFVGHIKAQELSPYIQVGESYDTMQEAYDKVIAALKDNSFSVIGAYNPEGKSSLKVIAFTQSNLKYTVLKVSDRGALAATFRVGLIKKNGKIRITYTNPEYLLRAYLGSSYDSYKPIFSKFSSDLKAALSSLGSDFTPFGGKVKATKLKKYHYMMGMPYFSDPVTLKEFSSFEEGLKTIQANLAARKGGTKLVYRLIFKSREIAVFGVALTNKTSGEAYFLPIIGEDNVAGMPYQIILQGKKATMLHGKYQLALMWPKLSMGTFMKIRNTPGKIEDALKAICLK